jgi:hypothetical protein
MAESDIRKSERHEKSASKHADDTTQGHAHHSEKQSEEHGHHEEHQHDRKKRRMNMKARIVPVLIALAISLITIEARAAIADVSDLGTISAAVEITPIDSIASTISATPTEIKKAIDNQIGSGNEIDYADRSDGGIANNSIRTIVTNDIDITAGIRDIDDENGINPIAIRSIIEDGDDINQIANRSIINDDAIAIAEEING